MKVPFGRSHRRTPTNERDRHRRTGRSWPTGPDHRGAVGVERPLPLPLAIDGARLPLRVPPPSIGEHSAAMLRTLGYRDDDVAALVADGVVRAAAA